MKNPTRAVLALLALVLPAAAQERTIGNAIDDTVISTRIKDKLLQASSSLFLRVGIEVLEGRVLLTGSVTNAQDRVEAVRLTWTVAGVRDLMDAAGEILPGAWQAALKEVRVGLRPAPAGTTPLVGPASPGSRVLLATGHFRNGAMLAPLTAREIVAHVAVTVGP